MRRRCRVANDVARRMLGLSRWVLRPPERRRRIRSPVSARRVFGFTGRQIRLARKYARGRTQGENMETTLPFTGQEYLDSLDDGREVWIYGERVGKISDHPAFRNTARMIARLYDALHEDPREKRGG